MDSILKFASSLSTVENYARDVYIKSSLTIELDKVVNQIKLSVVEDDDDVVVGKETSNRILIETPSIILFCDIIEAIFLHGLKEKLSSSSVVSNVFNTKPRPKSLFCLDFWSLIKILSHNEESKQLKHLVNISTDIGRCRAWIRLSLNECLLRSYLESLICDSSTLNSFYRSSAYLRDPQHTEMMRNLLLELDQYIFHLCVDNSSLNAWSSSTLEFLGIMIHDNEDSLMVATALDAMHLINDNKITKNTKKTKLKSKQKDPNKSEIKSEPESQDERINTEEIRSNDDDEISDNSKLEDNSSLERQTTNSPDDMETATTTTTPLNKKSESFTGNSLSVKSGWSTQPIILDDSYNALLESYSSRTCLSSTPDINDLKHSINLTQNVSNDGAASSGLDSESDFEILPKSIIASDDEENQKFFEKISKLAQEYGLDEQDYKCHLCSRPIGMIYGRCTICHIDGHLYCIECHGGEESLVPAQIIYNWSFKKYPVCKQNKAKLMLIENEPIFDLKILSPNLYMAIPEMAEITDLRTQLFYLHAYLFTCQEHIALKMRELVWPREHLFEHIHLYSLNDLQQIYNNNNNNNNILATTLRQVITYARKHISGCNLCKLKGFYCELCKDSDQILYPFDTDTTRRCDKCKSVFHLKCFLEKYDKNNCPKCLRMAKKNKQSITIISSSTTTTTTSD